MDKPKFKHECPNCTFLGRFDGEIEYDLYYCTQGGLPTIVARHGDPEVMYVSGMALSKAHPAIFRGKVLARKAGLIEARHPFAVDEGKKILGRTMWRIRSKKDDMMLRHATDENLESFRSIATALYMEELDKAGSNLDNDVAIGVTFDRETLHIWPVPLTDKGEEIVETWAGEQEAA